MAVIAKKNKTKDVVIAIKFYDMFAGIGGFRSGLEQAGGFECVGFCEIDPYAAAAYKALYNAEKEIYYSDITRIDTAEMPDFDLLVGGFPCQSYPEILIIPKYKNKSHNKAFNILKFGIIFMPCLYSLVSISQVYGAFLLLFQ